MITIALQILLAVGLYVAAAWYAERLADKLRKEAVPPQLVQHISWGVYFAAVGAYFTITFLFGILF